MKVVRFREEGKAPVYGILDNQNIEVLEGSPFQGLNRTGRTVALSEVQLLAPVEPPNVIAIGANYQEHINESNATTPERPLIFIKATTSVIGPNDTIYLPKVAPNEVDYEAELAIIIGSTARRVSESEALDYVFGYTCANDVSARDCQKRLDRQWARAKSFDTFCPLGPSIATDLDPNNLRIKSRLNGQTMQDGTTADMIYNCAFLISYISQAMTLLPGTVILTGTPSGVGQSREPAVFLRPDDVFEVEIEGIGVLENPVKLEV